MRLAKPLLLVLLSLLAGLAGCGDRKTESTTEPSKLSDRDQIQNVLTEIVTRWHYGDKAGLYDNEFPYLRARMTFDDYLKAKELQLEADTVKGINVVNAQIWDKDTALVDVEIVFEGPTGKISRLRDKYKLYYFGNRWIRPTLSVWKAQQNYEKIRREADSAAAAESDSD